MHHWTKLVKINNQCRNYLCKYLLLDLVDWGLGKVCGNTNRNDPYCTHIHEHQYYSKQSFQLFCSSCDSIKYELWLDVLQIVNILRCIFFNDPLYESSYHPAFYFAAIVRSVGWLVGRVSSLLHFTTYSFITICFNSSATGHILAQIEFIFDSKIVIHVKFKCFYCM